MKVLSLKQPWAELVVTGRKTIELRKWKPKDFSGEFLVHASKTPDREAMQRFGYNDSDLEYMAIVGKSNLDSVKKYVTEDEFMADKERHLAETMEWGSYGFVLSGSEKFEKSIPVPGKLSFWEYDY